MVEVLHLDGPEDYFLVQEAPWGAVDGEAVDGGPVDEGPPQVVWEMADPPGAVVASQVYPHPDRMKAEGRPRVQPFYPQGLFPAIWTRWQRTGKYCKIMVGRDGNGR